MPKNLTLKHENISGSEFEDLNMAGARFTNVNLSGAEFHDINFSDVLFTAAQIGGTTFRHIGLPPGPEDKQARQRPVTFENGVLHESVFHKMDMTNVKLVDCNVAGMTIDGILVTDLLKEWNKRNS